MKDSFLILPRSGEKQSHSEAMIKEFFQQQFWDMNKRSRISREHFPTILRGLLPTRQRRPAVIVPNDIAASRASDLVITRH